MQNKSKRIGSKNKNTRSLWLDHLNSSLFVKNNETRSKEESIEV